MNITTHNKKPITPEEVERLALAWLNDHNPRSAWREGVKKYVSDLVYNLSESCDFSGEIPAEMDETEKALELERRALNGARDWVEFSEGGSSLIYDRDIAERLSSPSELKKCTLRDGSIRDPNERENWIQCQGRALFQAFYAIRSGFYSAMFNA